MAMDQAETFEWLRERSNRLTVVEAELETAKVRLEESVGLLREIHDTDIKAIEELEGLQIDRLALNTELVVRAGAWLQTHFPQEPR